jgi:hypothetical protein
MTSDDVKNYPHFASWLQWYLPTLPYEKPKVWRAFEKYTGLYNVWVTRGVLGFQTPPVFIWGFGPTISARRWNVTRCEKDGDPEPKDNYFIQRYSSKLLGLTASDGSIILIAEDLAQGAGNPEMDKVLEATVLHELVHWCRFQIGQDVLDEDPPYDFEREAYGHVIRRTWDTCGSVEYYEVKK